MNRTATSFSTGLGLTLAAALMTAVVSTVAPSAQTAPKATPDTPFKLMTFDAGGRTRVGLVLGARVFDIEGANRELVTRTKVAAMTMPGEMKALIEQYATVSPRLYQIANYFGAQPAATLPFAFDVDRGEGAGAHQIPVEPDGRVRQLQGARRRHGRGRGWGHGAAHRTRCARRAYRTRRWRAASPAVGFDASAASRVVPDRDAPILFAKSPRSCIIDPSDAFYIVDGRGRTDYEAELAIIMGPRPAYRVPRERAMDYVFGYSIMQDLSDRGSERLREVSMFPGTNWFDGKSIDRAAPFGPVIVPKEFLPKGPSDLRITTKLNGTIVQDARTSNLIWSEPHLIAYITSRMTLYPGDVIITGTPCRHGHGAPGVPEAGRCRHRGGRRHRHADHALQGAVREAADAVTVRRQKPRRWLVTTSSSKPPDGTGFATRATTS